MLQAPASLDPLDPRAGDRMARLEDRFAPWMRGEIARGDPRMVGEALIGAIARMTNTRSSPLATVEARESEPMIGQLRR